jgi:hypothetical protein
MLAWSGSKPASISLSFTTHFRPPLIAADRYSSASGLAMPCPVLAIQAFGVSANSIHPREFDAAQCARSIFKSPSTDTSPKPTPTPSPSLGPPIRTRSLEGTRRETGVRCFRHGPIKLACQYPCLRSGLPLLGASAASPVTPGRVPDLPGHTPANLNLPHPSPVCQQSSAVLPTAAHRSRRLPIARLRAFSGIARDRRSAEFMGYVTLARCVSAIARGAIQPLR